MKSAFLILGPESASKIRFAKLLTNHHAYVETFDGRQAEDVFRTGLYGLKPTTQVVIIDDLVFSDQLNQVVPFITDGITLSGHDDKVIRPIIIITSDNHWKSFTSASLNHFHVVDFSTPIDFNLMLEVCIEVMRPLLAQFQSPGQHASPDAA